MKGHWSRATYEKMIAIVISRMDKKEAIRNALMNVVPNKKNKYVTSFTRDGDIKVEAVSADTKVGVGASTTISVGPYRPPTAQELQEMEVRRQETVVIAEQKIDNIYPRMREAARILNSIDDADLGNKMIARSELINIMREMSDANARYSQTMYPEKMVYSATKLRVKDIFIEQYRADENIGRKISFLKKRPFPLNEMVQRDGVEVAVQRVVAAAASVPGATGPDFTYIGNDPGYWLVPDFPYSFIYEGEVYNSVRQAIEAWKARSVQDEQLEAAVMNAPSALEARSLGVRNKPVPKDIIKNILTARINTRPLQITLKNMGDGPYALLDIDNILGIGITNVPSSVAEWAGANIYGNAITELVQEAKLAVVKTSMRGLTGRTRRVLPVVPQQLVAPPQPVSMAEEDFTPF